MEPDPHLRNDMAYHISQAKLNELEEIHERLNMLEASMFGTFIDKAKAMLSNTLTAHSISDYVHKKYSVEVTKDSESKLEFTVKDIKFVITKGADAKTFKIAKEGAADSMPFTKLTELDTLIKSMTHPQGMSRACQASVADVARYSRAVMKSQALRGV